VLGHGLLTAEVSHPSGAPSTAVRLSNREATLAYSGDTEWTDALLPIAADAQLFIVECWGYVARTPQHMTWKALEPRLPELRADRIMITHMNPTVLAHLDEIRPAGVLVAEDGAVINL
jgi:ribonuclease BN (tRNA processing enzyme)